MDFNGNLGGPGPRELRKIARDASDARHYYHEQIAPVSKGKDYHFFVFTARKRSLRRLCFYTCLSVILFTGGCLPQCMLGYTPPPRPEADTPWDQRQIPSGSRHPLPRSRHPPLHSACWEIRSTSGRYASYWNAYLFQNIISKSILIKRSAYR